MLNVNIKITFAILYINHITEFDFSTFILAINDLKSDAGSTMHLPHLCQVTTHFKVFVILIPDLTNAKLLQPKLPGFPAMPCSLQHHEAEWLAMVLQIRSICISFQIQL